MDLAVAGGLSWLEPLNSLRFFAADSMLCASSKAVLKVKSFSDNNRHYKTASLIPRTMRSRSIVSRVRGGSRGGHGGQKTPFRNHIRKAKMRL